MSDPLFDLICLFYHFSTALSMFDIHKVHEVHQHFSKLSLEYYLKNIVINSSPKPRRWGDIIEWWQKEIIAPKILMYESLAFPERVYKGPWSYFTTLSRGHDKTSLEGRLATWLLLASRRVIHGHILAADRDQGRLVLQAMQDEANLNSWVSSQLKFRRDGVSGPAGDIEILPADANSAYGLRSNFISCDEFCNWSTSQKTQELWRAVYTGTEKVQPRILGIITNAGTKMSFQHDFYLNALKDPDFVCYSAPGSIASWMPAERVAKMAANLPPSEARRLFGNEWILPGEDTDFLAPHEIEACRDVSLGYRLRRKPLVVNHVASIDYGPKRDRTVMVVGHQDASGVTVVDRMDVVQGSPEAPVPTGVVWNWITDINAGFAPKEYIIDFYGLNGVVEKMQASNLPVKEFKSRGGTGNLELAQTLRAAVASQNVRWYPSCGKLGDDTLESELAQVVAKKMSYGFRIDHESSKHDDRAVALGMLLCRTPEYPWQTEVARVTPVTLRVGDRR